MDEYVRRENIKRYRNLLRDANNELERRLIRKLLLLGGSMLALISLIVFLTIR